MLKQLISFAQVINFCKRSSPRGFNPPLDYALGLHVKPLWSNFNLISKKTFLIQDWIRFQHSLATALLSVNERVLCLR